MVALEKHIAETGAMPTESKIQALEEKEDNDAFTVKSRPSIPVIGKDTFYISTHSKWATVKLYTTTTPITAADLLNERVLPSFAEQGMDVLRPAD